MRFEDEPYVRIYKRKTLTWHKLGEKGRTVWFHLMLEFDRAGIIELGLHEPEDGVATLCDLSLETVAVGLAKCLELKCVVYVAARNCLFAPNFMTAQEAVQTNRLKQVIKRERIKARRLLGQLCEDPIIASLVEFTPVEEDEGQLDRDTSGVGSTPLVSLPEDEGQLDRDTSGVGSTPLVSVPTGREKCDSDSHSGQSDTSGVGSTPLVSERHSATTITTITNPPLPSDLNGGWVGTPHANSGGDPDERLVELPRYRPSDWLVAQYKSYGLTDRQVSGTLRRYRDQARIGDAPQAAHDQAFEAFLRSTLQKGTEHENDGRRGTRSGRGAGAESAATRPTAPDPRNGGRPARRTSELHARLEANQSLLRLPDRSK